jgi:drug/metabolite transporter (DMT)-like permease
LFAIIAIYALLATTFVIAKLALAFAHPFFLIGVRMTLAGLILGGWLFFTSRKCLKIKKEDLFSFLKITFFHVYLAFSCEFWALQYLSSAKTNLIYTSTPFIAAILSYFILGEKLSWKKSLGLTLGLIGLMPVTLTNESNLASSWFQEEMFPEAVLMIAVVSAAYAWFEIKKMMNKGYSLVLINGFAMFVGGIASLLSSWIFFGNESFTVTQPLEFLKYVGLMIVVSNLIFYNAYAWLMKKHSITFLTFAGFLSPVFGAIYGRTLLNEEIGWQYACSLVLITIALYIFYKEESNLREAKLKKTAPVDTI